MAAPPIFTAPVTTDRYDREDEAQFRRDVERQFQELARYFAGQAESGTPSTLSSGNNNNFDPGTLTILRLTPNASGSTLTGIKAPRTEKTLTVVNLGSADLTLAHESASSTAENRFTISTGANFVLAANESAQLTYDRTSARWRVNGGSVGFTETQSFSPTGAGTTNDLALNDDTRILTINNDGSARNLTGFTGGTGGRPLMVRIITGTNFTIQNDNAGSQAANRIITLSGADTATPNGQIYEFLYDSTAARWYMTSSQT